MRSVFLLPMAVAACATPSINVKEQWTDAVKNYGFVPLYPPRADVVVGDVRVHTLDANKGPVLKSRPMLHINMSGDLDKGRSFPLITEPADEAGVRKGWFDRRRAMALPALEAIRVSAADARGTFPFKLWNFILDAQISDAESVAISLDDLTSVEVSDDVAVPAFLAAIEEKMKDESFRDTLCAQAITIGDPSFEKTRISMITRVAYVEKVKYSYGDTFKSTLKATVNSVLDEQEQARGSTSLEQTKTLSLEDDFEKDPLAFGVDAVMIDPLKMDKDLGEHCKKSPIAFSPNYE